MGWGMVNSGSGSGGGGIAPGNMKTFTASSERGKVKLSCVLPGDTVVEGMLLATVAGAKVLRRTDRFPESEYDGNLIKDLKKNEVFVDQDTRTGVTYYYAAFPYTDTGTYNRNPANRVQFAPKLREYLYGYDLVQDDSNPATRVSYPTDVDNAGFEKAYMDFSGGKFVPGGWNLTPGHHFMPRPCVLGFDGKVKYYLNPDDYSQKENGQLSNVNQDSCPGNAMMQWPKIYTLRWDSQETLSDGRSHTVYHFRCSDVPIDKADVGAPVEAADSDCWCNYDRNNNQIPAFYTPIYIGSNVSGQLRSLSGKTGYAASCEAAVNAAKKNGMDWYMEVVSDYLLIEDLSVLIAKTSDSQTAFGNGYVGSGNHITSGTMDRRGLFYGSSAQNMGVKIFGMENLWGDNWRWIAGWVNDHGTQKLKIKRGATAEAPSADYNDTGDGYEVIEGARFSGSTDGYITKMKTTPYGRIPYGTGGGSSTLYEADSLWYSNSVVAFPFTGGGLNYGMKSGIFSVWLTFAYTYSWNDISAALSCKPLAGTEV